MHPSYPRDTSISAALIVPFDCDRSTSVIYLQPPNYPIQQRRLCPYRCGYSGAAKPQRLNGKVQCFFTFVSSQNA